MNFELDLISAKQCLSFTNKLVQDGKESNQDDMPEDLMDNLEGFQSFLSLSVNSEIEKITIPERYRRVYGCIIDTAFTFLMAEKFNIDPVLVALSQHIHKNIQ